MIKTSYHDSVNVLQGLSLHDAHAGVSAPFDRLEWFALLEKAGLQPFVAMAEEGEDRVALVLQKDGASLKALRNWYSFSWRPFTSPSPEADILLTELAEELKAQSDRLILEPVPEELGAADNLAAAFRAAGWKVAITPCDTNHVLDVSGQSFAEYWQDRPGPLRTTLKRKAKRVTVEIYTAFDGEAWADYEQIYAASWKPAEDYPDMLREFAQQEGDAGRLRLGVARADGIAVAAQLWTVENSVAYIHKLAHLESHAKLSAGTTLSAALFERVIDEDRVDLVDFGTGDEPYKADWMGRTRQRMRIECFNTGSPKGWLGWSKHRLQRLLG